jgi:carbon storage regulator
MTSPTNTETTAAPGDQRPFSPEYLSRRNLMLVLNRKVGERIVIADKIVITVIEVRGDRVRLGIEAPPSVPVWREELVAHATAFADPQRHPATAAGVPA